MLWFVAAEDSRNTSSLACDISSDEKGNRTSKPILLEKKVSVTGDMLTDARVNFSAGGFGGVAVVISFNKIGARRFEKLTAENVQKRLAIVLDNKVQSARC